jgi:CTP synthase
VSLIPVLGSVGEQKTKPTQHGVKELMSLGLSPDIIVCRSKEIVHLSTRKKISAFCHVAPSCVVSVHDVSNIYHVPLVLEEQGLHNILRDVLDLGDKMNKTLDLASWRKLANTVDQASEDVVITVVGKYTGLHDAYLSVIKALKHASIECNKNLLLSWIESADLEEETKVKEPSKYAEAWKMLREADGVLIPGGFGDRGIEGKLVASRYARENCVPTLGVCLGMQVMVIEYARNVLKWADATSAEIDEATPTPVIVKMLEHHQGQMGGTMRLGARETILHPLPKEDAQPKSIASLVYKGETSVMERHRHRYEVNPEKIADFEKHGLRFTGKDETNTRMEIVELPRKVHPFYFGAQFHPELKSRPERPSPPFLGLVLAATNSFSKHYGVPESKAARPVNRGTKRMETPRASEFSAHSGAPGVSEMKRPRILSDSKST